MTKTSKRGGLRNPPGGRPAIPVHLRRVRCGDVTLPPWLKAWLRANKSKERPMGQLVEEALVAHYGLKRPG